MLRLVHLVTTRRDGPRVHYRLADTPLADLLIQAFSHAELPGHHLPKRLSGGVH